MNPLVSIPAAFDDYLVLSASIAGLSARVFMSFSVLGTCILNIQRSVDELNPIKLSLESAVLRCRPEDESLTALLMATVSCWKEQSSDTSFRYYRHHEDW